MELVGVHRLGVGASSRGEITQSQRKTLYLISTTRESLLGNRSNSAWSSAQALAAKTVADGNGKKAQERRHFDKDFTTVEQVRVSVLEIRVSENTVQEEQHRRGKDKIVQAPPQRTANTGAEQGREEHEQEEIERCGTGEVKFG